MTKTILAVSAAIVLSACGGSTVTSQKKDKPKPSDNVFHAVSMPSKMVSGTVFPTDSNTINSWVKNSKIVNNTETNKDIITHGWDIWAALTEMTDQTDNNQKLRRFETWFTPTDIINAFKLRKSDSLASLTHLQRGKGLLKKMRQVHGSSEIETSDAGVIGFVKFDSTSAAHIFNNDLFYASTLDKLIKKDALAEIVNFPTSGVILKPVFQVLTADSNSKFMFPVWPGEQGNPNRPFGSSDWGNNVEITITGKTDTANRVYSVSEFINFQIDSAQAASYGSGAKAGDYAVLQAMHVNTRETKRWTWQTFWWSEKNDTPFKPSSDVISGLRPTSNLDKSANHYAMALAYNMVSPVQPNNGGSGDSAVSIYAYNPYLEAGFDTSTFAAANDTVQKYYSADYQKVGGFTNKYGMQTNCMSCHGQARYIPGLYGGKGHLYITDQYFSLDAPYFKNFVKLDFAWSIQGNLIDDNENILK